MDEANRRQQAAALPDRPRVGLERALRPLGVGGPALARVYAALRRQQGGSGSQFCLGIWARAGFALAGQGLPGADMGEQALWRMQSGSSA